MDTGRSIVTWRSQVTIDCSIILRTYLVEMRRGGSYTSSELRGSLLRAAASRSNPAKWVFSLSSSLRGEDHPAPPNVTSRNHLGTQAPLKAFRGASS